VPAGGAFAAELPDFGEPAAGRPPEENGRCAGTPWRAPCASCATSRALAPPARSGTSLGGRKAARPARALAGGSSRHASTAWAPSPIASCARRRKRESCATRSALRRQRRGGCAAAQVIGATASPAQGARRRMPPSDVRMTSAMSRRHRPGAGPIAIPEAFARLEVWPPVALAERRSIPDDVRAAHLLPLFFLPGLRQPAAASRASAQPGLRAEARRVLRSACGRRRAHLPTLWARPAGPQVSPRSAYRAASFSDELLLDLVGGLPSLPLPLREAIALVARLARRGSFAPRPRVRTLGDEAELEIALTETEVRSVQVRWLLSFATVKRHRPALRGAR